MLFKKIEHTFTLIRNTIHISVTLRETPLKDQTVHISSHFVVNTTSHHTKTNILTF